MTALAPGTAALAGYPQCWTHDRVTHPGGLISLWFNDRVREAHEASRNGDHRTAIELLGDLAEECGAGARAALSEWHEIQALWLLGVELEGQKEFAYATRAYTRIARLRRDALQEASHGLGSAAAAAALCAFCAGNLPAGIRLATEALRMHASRPLGEGEAHLLESELAKAQTRLRSKKRRRRNRAASNKRMQRTRPAQAKRPRR